MKLTVLSLFLTGLSLFWNGTTGLEALAAADCTVPFTDIGGRCLFLENLVHGTWNDMRYHCQRFGGDLAKVDSADLLAAIVAHIHAYDLSDVHYWIGGTDEGHEGDWRWLDGSPVTLGTPFWCYYFEAAHQRPLVDTPDVNCILLNVSHFFYFYDFYCDLDSGSHPFGGVCEQQ